MKTTQNAFTLIEMMVVIAIISFLMVLSAPGYKAYQLALSVRTSAKGLRSLLWEGQARSLAPEDTKITSFDIELKKGQGYGVAFQLIPVGVATPKISTFNYERNASIESMAISSPTIPQRNIDDIILKFRPGNNSAGSIAGFEVISGVPTDLGKNLKLTIITSSPLTPAKYKVTVDTFTNNIAYDKV